MPRKLFNLKENSPKLCINCRNFSPQNFNFEKPCIFRKRIPYVFCRKQTLLGNFISHYEGANLPEVMKVRKAIESIKEEKYRVYMMTVYLCGAARACEIAYKRTSADIKKGYVRNYGPYGDDCWLDETEPPDPR